jgi:hypothetical protein
LAPLIASHEEFAFDLGCQSLLPETPNV